MTDMMDTSDIESTIAGPPIELSYGIQESVNRGSRQPESGHTDKPDTTRSRDHTLAEPMDQDITTIHHTRAENSHNDHNSITATELVPSTKFDEIASNINSTIQQITKIYNQIGYSQSEVTVKRSEIFTVISDTISNFTTNLEREKNTIENECEWLRQQIRLILSMINDSTGESNLSTMNRGIVFNDRALYEEGYKQMILTKLSHNNTQTFYSTSPFNLDTQISEIPQSKLEIQYQTMMETIPQLSLLQLKSSLNCIFLTALRAFMEPFKKLISLAQVYSEHREIIGEVYSPSVNLTLLQNLPNRSEIRHQNELVERFESTIRSLHLDENLDEDVFDSSKESLEHTYIISSPRKMSRRQYQLHERATSETISRDISSMDGSTTTLVGHQDTLSILKDTNYQLIQTIRTLKITKISPEHISSLQIEINFCQQEIQSRCNRVIGVIEDCSNNINTLCLNNSQLIEIQKQYDISGTSDDSVSNEGYFDIETLNFIKSEPRNFGLRNDHITYLERFANILKRKRDAKQKKYDQYVSKCKGLWTKFGESDSSIEQFLDANNSLSDVSLLNFKIELNRLTLMRSKYIEKFICDTRAQIENMWSRLYYSDSERRKFKHYYRNNGDSQDVIEQEGGEVSVEINAEESSSDKEQILAEHEEEYELLHKEVREKETILQQYDLVVSLLKDQDFLRESSKDSSRLLSKNSCKILLNEEKLRKRINKQLPKSIQQLKVEIQKYNESNLTSDIQAEEPARFRVNGADLYDKILSIEETELKKPNRPSKSKPPRPLQSPTKNSHRVTKVSPTKTARTLRSPINIPNKNTSNRIRSNLEFEKAKTSPDHTASMTGAARNRPVLHRINKAQPDLSQASNFNNFSSFGGSTVSSLESPVRFNSKNSSFLSNTHLQPLISPLLPRGSKPTKSIDFEDTTQIGNHSTLSNISNRMSPLRASAQNRLNTSKKSHNSAYESPVSTQSIQRSPKITKDKENSFPYESSPLKLQEKSSFFDAKVSTSSSRRLSTMTCDSSTVVGDDYQTWRDEKIQQFNNEL